MLIFVKNDDCVSYKMTFHHVFIYLFRFGLHFVPGLQSAVCSLQSAFCTDRLKINAFLCLTVQVDLTSLTTIMAG